MVLLAEKTRKMEFCFLGTWKWNKIGFLLVKQKTIKIYWSWTSAWVKFCFLGTRKQNKIVFLCYLDFFLGHRTGLVVTTVDFGFLSWILAIVVVMILVLGLIIFS